MNAAGAVTIIAVALIVAALVYYLVSVIVQLRKITAGLDEAIVGVSGIVEKSAPVNDVVTTINQQLDAGVDLLEGLLVKKAGLADAVGLVDGLYPGAAAAGLRNFPESTEITVAADRRGLHEGDAHAGAARPRGADRRSGTRPARPSATSRAEASQRGSCTRRSGRRGRSPFPGLRSSAPTRPFSTRSGRTSGSRASGCRVGREPPTSRFRTLRRKEPCADPCAIRVRARDQRRRRDRDAAAARLGRTRHRGRTQPAPDDEAPAGEAEAPGRHQRPRRALVHPRGGRRGTHRGADPARPAPALGRARAALSRSFGTPRT